MAYIDKTYLLNRVSLANLTRWTDDERTGSPDDDKIAAACEEATARVDAYLQARYATPLTQNSTLIKSWTASLAIYLLAARKGLDWEKSADRVILEEKKNVVASLKALAAGGISLTSDDSEAAESNIEVDGERAFSRDSMKNF